ncbi:MAG: hypothetical protein HKP48_08725 [Winogradskyella sp.]|uniref:DUF5689 domain-containing protein n=1 Tax=Winogradskyella sp. TaxID=1883156 RepID=UPI0017E04F47|nr:DUF5689 domain-containing protein [Winogradskyella sp.]MBT8243668.1 choice-of-anchor J domain-containing protein [Winogradskyella sp.]NNK23357.1 hypothetical protein [Winogradskyella sp.]
MKILKINKFILLLIGLVAFNSCVEDDDFNIPNTAVIEPVLSGTTIEISSVAGELAQEQGNSTLDYSNDDTFYTYPSDAADQFVTGYVVSSDEGGNYFEELILQNAPENPTIGIRVLVDVNPLFIRYEVGRKVYVKVNSLSIGISNGVLTLGPLDDDRIGKIPAPSEEDFIQRSAEIATMVPLQLGINEFTDDKTNLLISLDNVQFIQSQAVAPNALSFASEPSDEFDGERTLEDCTTGASTVFATSTFADFKALTLPAGRGSMTAVLQKNFFGDEFNIVINSPEDIDMTGDRCDPVFSADFQEATDNTTFNTPGWINFAEAGTELWSEDVFSGNGTARFSAFSTGESSNIGWLITPSIYMDAQTGEVLTFEMQHAFPDAGHDPMEVLYSNDFDGTEAGVLTATWTSMPFTKSYIVDSGNWFTFINSGPIDLSGVTGNAYIAFKYTGSDTANQNMTIDIDNVKISVQ